MNEFIIVVIVAVFLGISVLINLNKASKEKLEQAKKEVIQVKEDIKKTEEKLKEVEEKKEQLENFVEVKQEYEQEKETFRDNSIDSANASLEFVQKLSERGKQRNK